MSGVLIDQEKIHNQCLSEDPEEIIKALEQLKKNFSSLPNKEQAWNDLHRVTNDKRNRVRNAALYALYYVFWAEIELDLTSQFLSSVSLYKSFHAFCLSGTWENMDSIEETRTRTK